MKGGSKVIPKVIEIENKEYRRGKIIKGKKYTYIEYKNVEIGKIKFFQKENSNIKDITDKDDLKEAIEENYITESNI